MPAPKEARIHVKQAQADSRFYAELWDADMGRLILSTVHHATAGEAIADARQYAQQQRYTIIGQPIRKLPYQPKPAPRCPHCHRRTTSEEGDNPARACVNCNRDMCDDCISLHIIGYVCGLCYDRLTQPEPQE